MFEDSLINDFFLEVHGFLVVEELEVVDGFTHNGGLDIVDIVLPSADTIQVDQSIQFEKSVTFITEFGLERFAVQECCSAVQLLNTEEAIHNSVDVA